ncbi:hypothetical protein NDU88_007713 [Pleurodeles waltl]|uniref:Uncharacterized protein n=1 Tax=Pleurodeles waltl TaxID=8319 RepID=A0AAV7N2T5_PLEWA|nr:hypothetical protein NDU88_007713 [Pleurodeles waltl]
MLKAPTPPHDRAGRRPNAARSKKSERPEPRSRGATGLPIGGKWRLARVIASPRGLRPEDATWAERARRAGAPWTSCAPLEDTWALSWPGQ